MNEFKIKPREILSSIGIIAIMLMIGFGINNKISDHLLEKYQKYDTALQINNDQRLFEHNMNTDVGYAFVYGDLKAIDTVTYDEIGGKYTYVKKVKEKYTRHTRRVKSGKTWHTQVYYTWDYAGEESKHCKNISFVNHKFKYGMINFPDSKHLKTIKESSKIRYKYYVCETKYTGTLFANLGNKTINEVSFYNNLSIEEAIKRLETGYEHLGFWMIWIILIGLVVFGYYYLDNDWLDD